MDATNMEKLDEVEGDPGISSRQRRMPDAYIILFLVIVLTAALTYVVPAGSFLLKERPADAGSEEAVQKVIDRESFRYLRDENGALVYKNVSLFSGEADLGERRIHRFPSDAQGDTGLFNYVFEGMTSGSKYGAAVGIVAFILIIGGSFGVLMRTGAIEAGILFLVARAGKREWVFIPLIAVVFSLGGAVFGMGEEAIAFAMILVPLTVALGYDSITGVMITYVATQVGFATSWMNPFSVAVAQGLAEVPVLSGAGLRMVLWVVFTAALVAATMFHAHRVKRKPQCSPSYRSDAFFRVQVEQAREVKGGIAPSQAVILGLFFLGIGWILYGVLVYQYFIPEIATQFFVIAVGCGTVAAVCRTNGMNFNGIAESFREGAAQLLGPAMIVGMAKGVLIVLGGDSPETPSVLNTILHGAGSLLEPVSSVFSAWLMFVLQCGINFFVPSGTGQAALTVPLMAPLGDFAGVTRQTAVLAFQLGDGLTNLIIPTSASLMGALAVARIDFMVWLRFILPLQAVFYLLCLGALAFAVLSGYT